MTSNSPEIAVGDEQSW